MHDLFGIGPWVVNFNFHAVLFQFFDDIDCAGVADIRAVFFEGDAEQDHFCSFYLELFMNHEFDHFGGYIFAHIVVEPAACKDDFGVVAVFLCFLGKVVGVDADAVTSDEARPKGKKVPFGACGFKNFVSVDAHAVENHGQFVDKGYVDVALGVFNYFGCFGHFD